MDRLDGFVRGRGRGALIGIRTAASMPRRAGSGMVRRCTSGRNPQLRAQQRPRQPSGTVTVLGATGSVGMSTVDLLKREPRPVSRRSGDRQQERRRPWRRSRANSSARFAVVADPAAYGELKDALAGHRHRGRGGRGRADRGGAAAGRMGDGGGQRRGRAEADARRGRARRDGRARQQGMPGLRRRRCSCARAAAAGATVLPVDSEHNAIFQALTAGPREDVSRIILTASGGPFRTWTREIRCGDAKLEQALQASELVDGAEDHHQFRDHDEQGPGADRGASSVRASSRTRSTCWCIRNRSSTAWSNIRDGSVIAQLGSPDMRIPIAHCLAWPVADRRAGGHARSGQDRER